MPNCTCSVPGCHSSYFKKDKDLKFHRIGGSRAIVWIKAIKRYDLLAMPAQYLKHKYICSLHFEECMYGPKYLRKNAVPTLLLPTDYDHSLLEAPPRPTTSQTGIVVQQNTTKRKRSDDQELNTESTDVVIKYEPPEPSEMTIEQDQIGYYKTTKRQHLNDPFVEDSANPVIPKKEAINDDDQVERCLIMYDNHENHYVERALTIPKKEDAECFVENEIMTNDTVGMLIPKPSERSIKKVVLYTKKTLKSNKKTKMKKLITINNNKKKEALKQFLLGCDLYLSPQLSSIIKEQLNSKGNHFTNDYKIFCFHLFISSPRTYNFLSQVLCLPSRNDLIKTYFTFDSAINKEVFGILSEISNKMSSSDKECVLTFGEIKLKRSVFYDAKADRVFGLDESGGIQKAYSGCYAYTMMLKGIVTDWKLFIGFAFSLVNKLNTEFMTWLKGTIAQLFHIGFKLRAVCIPVLPTFTELALNIVEFPENECYMEIDGKKVYFIFEIRSILKKARNELMKHTLTMEDRIASWTCVRQLYQVDHNKGKRLVPQLTKLHIRPKKQHLKKLRYASEVIDTSVAVALNVYADKKYLKPYFGTIQFIHTISKVFNILKCDKTVACSDEEKQLFDKTRDFLNSIVAYNRHNRNKLTQKQILFKDALLITLNSISQLGDDIQSENLVVKRSKLIYSCMQSFYDVMRQMSGHSRRVTCREYLRAFRRIFIFHVLSMAENKDTTLMDTATFLQKYEKYVQDNKIYQTTKHKQSKDILPRFLHISEEHRFISLCSYLLQKCVEKHECPKLTEYVNSSVAHLNPEECGIAGLRVPPDHFLIYCTNLENYLQYSFSYSVGDNICKSLFNKLRQLYFDKPCECFPADFVIKMFIKMRIRYNNLLHNRIWNNDTFVANSTYECIPM